MPIPTMHDVDKAIHDFFESISRQCADDDYREEDDKTLNENQDEESSEV